MKNRVRTKKQLITELERLRKKTTEIIDSEKKIEDARLFAESVIATIREPLLVLDANLRVIMANRSFYRTFKTKPKETEGRFIYKLGEGEWNIPELRKLLENILPQNTSFENFEVEYTFKKVGKRTLLLNARRIYKKRGKTQLILLAIEDITEIKKTHQSIKHLNDVLKAIRKVNQLITHTESYDKLLRNVCKLLVDVIRYNVVCITYNNKIYKAGKQTQCRELLSFIQNIKTARKLVTRSLGENFVVISPIKKKDVYGTLYILSAKPFSREEKDLISEISSDIGYAIRSIHTSQIENDMRIALRESEEKYRTVVEHSNDGIVILQDGIIKFANRKLSELLGYKIEEGLNTPFEKYIDPEELPRVAKRYRDRLAGKKVPRVYETILRHKDGHRVYVDISVRVIRYKGEVAELGFLRDITERKKAEEELEIARRQLLHSQKMEAIGRLTSSISHEFNNLLLSIDGYIELISKGLQPDDIKQRFIKQIKKVTEHAKNLISQLLTFSRKHKFQLETVNINSIIKQMKEILERVTGKNIALILKLKPHIATVKVDRGQIEQVIMNMAINACDAMPDGGRLTISTDSHYLNTADYRRFHPRAYPGKFVSFSIADTGVGMEQDTIDYIFEPFFTTKEKSKGTGLGLSTAYGIIKQHKGWIDVKSEPGIGSTFTVYLPAV